MEVDPILIGICLTLIFSAFFSGIEIAFVSSDKLQLELRSKSIPIAGKVISYFINSPSHFMGVTLVGNTAALVLFGMFMTEYLRPVFMSFFPDFFAVEFNFFIIQTVVSTLIVLLLAEFLPKSLFLINPIKMMTTMAFPLMVIYWILYIPMLIVISLSKGVLNLFGQKYEEDKPVYGLTDLNNFVKSIIEFNENSDANVEIDARILNNALEFKTVRVRECMIPRTEISAVDINDGMEEVRSKFTESGHSKILIYKDNIDQVLGYCHALEMFRKPRNLKSILTPIIIVPETELVNELMVQFISEKKSLALVVDEYGGTSGVVSMEDIIEEIFGEIKDEHDDEELVETRLDNETFLLSARLEIDYLNDKYAWELPEGEYETLGGLFIAIHEDLPEIGEKIAINDFILTIHSVHDTRIETIKLQVA